MAVQETEDQRTQRMGIIEAFSAILKEKRADAIQWRAASGIEQVWEEDKNHYDGVDDATRGTTSKGRNATDGLSDTKKKANTRSTVFLKITRPYCDAAAARVADMLLPSDDRNWEIRPTPLPKMKAALKDDRPVTDVLPPEQIAQKKSGGVMGAIKGMFGAAPTQPAAKEPTVAEVAHQEMGRAKEKAEAAQTQIDDWLVECRYHAELRKVIESAARLGTGILKGPTPGKKKTRVVSQTEEGGWTVELTDEILPQSKAVALDKFYPDPNCGDDIHRGACTWEEDDITARELSELRGVPGYIAEMIDLCLEEGPTSPVTGTRKNKEGQKTQDKDVFQIWYFNGQVSKKDMEAAGCACGDKAFYPCVVTMVNDRAVKVSLSPLDSGEFPYDVMVWQPQPDHWAGVGVARQMRECQKGANAAIRNVMDNAGLGAGPQIIVDRTKVIPANGRWELAPRKIWWTKDGVEVADVSKAFTVAVIPMLIDALMPLLQFWLKEAEDVTGLPMLLQGQQGKTPDTVGVTTILNNNGSTVLRRIARTFDDRITEPHITRYYEYLLLHGPDECKGDFSIDARGSSALVERDMQNQALMQLLQLAPNPIYELDAALVMAEVLKGMKFDTKRLVLSDEKKEQMAKQPPPEDPAVTAAKIREDGALKREKLKSQLVATQGDANRGLEKAMKEIDAQLANAELSADERAQLQNHKVDLATVTMKLRQQAALSPGPQVMTPPTEPAGKAPAGMAFPQ